MTSISISRRLRHTPFTERVTLAGVKSYTVYNHMLLPTAFRSMEEDYHHLKSAVQVWDVACERQVELSGPDAGRLVQLMTPRDISRQKIGQTIYTPICDKGGYILNDPVTIRLDENRYWVSIADSDVILFAKGLATGMDLDVEIFEPDIHPLAVQGPKANQLMARVFGDGIRDTKFFGTQTHMFGGRTHVIARSGYSGQGGFEIYLNGADLGPLLWDTLMEAGADLDVKAGCPNLIERIESGLLSYGNDMGSSDMLHETGLMRFCKTIAPDCIAHDALMAVAEPERKLCYLTLDGAEMSPLSQSMDIYLEGQNVGQITSAVWSPDYESNVAIGMIKSEAIVAGNHLVTDNGLRTVTILTGPVAATQRKANQL